VIVVDTNTIAYLYLNSEHSAQAEQLLIREPVWLAPKLWLSEFRNVLALYLRKNILTLTDALQIARTAESLMNGRDYQVSSPDVLLLAQSSGCSAYDCEFVALAQANNLPLITADKKVLAAFPGMAYLISDFLSNG
jgi:predicted nucleic acid-binding protein